MRLGRLRIRSNALTLDATSGFGNDAIGDIKRGNVIMGTPSTAPKLVVLTVAFMLAAFAGSARSQGSDTSTTGVLEEVIVTAQKREERLQDVPIAISAITSSLSD